MPDAAMSISPDLITAEQLARPPYSEHSCQLVDGQVENVTPASWRHGAVAGRIHGELYVWAKAHGGQVVGAETGFVVRRNPDTVRAPDVAFLRAGRPVHAAPFVEGAPDLAVEVLSPDARAGATARMVRDYLLGGAAEVWVVDPENGTVTVHTPPNRAVVLGAGDALRGGELLPGFALGLDELFAD